MKKYFLTSILLAGFIAPGYAADDNFITGGAGTCTFDVLGVYDNNATANTIATWSLNSYDCAAGQYLDETTLECIECPTGSYCPGGTFTVEANNSKTACPTDYTSDAAATAESECYMGCELACNTNAACPAHSNNCTHSEFKTTGKQFAGSTCNAYPNICPIADFGCDTGYSKQNIAYSPLLEMALMKILADEQTYGDLSTSIMWNVHSCTLDNTDEFQNFGAADIDGYVNACEIVEPGQVLVSNMILIEFSQNQYGVDTPGVIVGNEYEDLEHFISTPYYLLNANFDRTITGDNLWYTISKVKIDTPDSLFFMETLQNIDTDNTTVLTDEMVQYLRTNITPANWPIVQAFLDKIETFNSTNEMLSAALGVYADLMQWQEINSPWIRGYHSNIPFISLWTEIDVYSDGLKSEDSFVSLCTNNTININWNPDNGGEHTQNMCYYDGTIKLPSDPVKPGYTFTGWKLLESTTTE